MFYALFQKWLRAQSVSVLEEIWGLYAPSPGPPKGFSPAWRIQLKTQTELVPSRLRSILWNTQQLGGIKSDDLVQTQEWSACVWREGGCFRTTLHSDLMHLPWNYTRICFINTFNEYINILNTNLIPNKFNQSSTMFEQAELCMSIV